MSKTAFQYRTSRGNSLQADLYGPASGRPLILYVHGLKGFKDWGFVPFTGEFFAKNGFSFVAFNFSHNGIGPDMENFTEEAAFSQNTYSLEVSELREMIELCSEGAIDGKLASRRLGLLGHSRGGGIALLAAQASPEVQAVCTWASISTVDRYEKHVYEAWKKKGYMEVLNSRTGQVLKMGAAMLKDIQKNGKSSLNILSATKHLGKPLLILHGSKDEAVRFYEAESLNIYADSNRSEMRLIPGAGHTFGAKHPFAGSNPKLDETLQFSLEFFKRELG
ncbi:MAG: prolyl oligopeptidase family serine peptidase [Bacteroidia bacterium]